MQGPYVKPAKGKLKHAPPSAGSSFLGGACFSLPNILTINGGSSSIKFALYQLGETLKRTLMERSIASA